MKKYIFTESQIKNIIDGVISEQTSILKKEQPQTVWTRYKNGKTTTQNVIDYFAQIGVSKEKLGEYLRQLNHTNPGLFEKNSIINFLKEAGLPQINKHLKSAPGARSIRPSDTDGTFSIMPGGGLGTTGSGHVPRCAGGNCNLREQVEESNQTKAVQNFLNTKLKANLKVDGIVGPATKQAIEKYQGMIHVFPTDGVWGPETEKLMPRGDKKIYDDYLAAQGDVIDKVLNLFR